MENPYSLRNAAEIPSPALVYYKEILAENTEKAIALAGGAHRLWPHVKTHKMASVVRLQMEMGVSRFKCATLGEAEMLCRCGVSDALVAYPMAGPNIARFSRLQAEFPATRLWAVADDLGQLRLLAETAGSLRLLIDADMGMGRTGVPLQALESFAAEAARIPGVHLLGVHGYDGHQHAVSIEERKQDVGPAWEALLSIRERLRGRGIELNTLVMGGTPTFPCYAPFPEAYCSPGTCFLTDWGYLRNLPELPFRPAAALLTRVISRPRSNRFTLDLGCKAIAADPPGQRGVIVGLEAALPVLHSEEHWVFELSDPSALPPVGQALYVIPTHICPTTSLYPFVYVAENGSATERWEVTARDR